MINATYRPSLLLTRRSDGNPSTVRTMKPSGVGKPSKIVAGFMYKMKTLLTPWILSWVKNAKDEEFAEDWSEVDIEV